MLMHTKTTHIYQFHTLVEHLRYNLGPVKRRLRSDVSILICCKRESMHETKLASYQAIYTARFLKMTVWDPITEVLFWYLVQCSEAVWITKVRMAQSTLNPQHFLLKNGTGIATELLNRIYYSEATLHTATPHTAQQSN